MPYDQAPMGYGRSRGGGIGRDRITQALMSIQNPPPVTQMPQQAPPMPPMSAAPMAAGAAPPMPGGGMPGAAPGAMPPMPGGGMQPPMPMGGGAPGMGAPGGAPGMAMSDSGVMRPMPPAMGPQY